MKVNFVFDLQDPSRANDPLANRSDIWPNGSYSSDTVYVTIYSVSDIDKAKESHVLPLSHDNVELYKKVFQLTEASSQEGEGQRVHVTNFDAGAAQDLRALLDLKMGKGSVNTSLVKFVTEEFGPGSYGDDGVTENDISFMYSEFFRYQGATHKTEHCADKESLVCAWDAPEIYRIGMTYWQEDDEEYPLPEVHFCTY